MMNEEAAKSCLGWEGINNRTLITSFMTKKCRVSVIVVYTPVNPTNGDSRDSCEFYLQLQEQKDRVQGRKMVFLLGDFKCFIIHWYKKILYQYLVSHCMLIK